MTFCNNFTRELPENLHVEIKSITAARPRINKMLSKHIVSLKSIKNHFLHYGNIIPSKNLTVKRTVLKETLTSVLDSINVGV